MFFNKLSDAGYSTLAELIAILRETYCRTIGVEFMHIRDTSIRKWLLDRMEPNRNRPQLDPKKKRRIIYKLNAAELFETFLQEHYVGQKRFSLEGGEMLIPLLDAVIERAGASGVREIILGMPHRGRLNVLANVLDKPYGMIFNEFEGDHLPETVGGDGDVKYHLGFSADHVTSDKHTIHLSLSANPSHLEAVNPVVEGRVRAKQRRFKDRDRRLGIPVLIHGDAAFAGQGLVAETLNLSQLPGLSDRRYHPHRRQQSNRLHDGPLRGPIDSVLHRRRQDDRSADLPRQWRGSRSRRPRRRAGTRLSPGLRQRRGDRYVLLPPPRPQRGRRAGIHPAPHVSKRSRTG